MKIIPLFLFFTLTIAAQPTHEDWTKLLQTYVNSSGEVDYIKWKKDQYQLDDYLIKLSRNPPNENWSNDEVLSYWINAYNAFTVELIIDHYPLPSILFLINPWKRDFIFIGEKKYNLHTIEHDILRKMNEPRIHFAINCASVSCPNLFREAFESKTLEEQLNHATLSFLSDSSKNSFEKDVVYLSKIFKWFEEDFTEDGNLIDFLNLHLAEPLNDQSKIRFKSYNWSLNNPK